MVRIFGQVGGNGAGGRKVALQSLALAYRDVLVELTAVSGQKIDVIHIVGGGAKNKRSNISPASLPRSSHDRVDTTMNE
ncbi:MAG TPA: hypothetical protein EYP41_08235, partial [Anaerolineae bacterium]|nr:hypothetical protein [Anaerolineae bacterium]